MIDNWPLISIITPSYNQGPYIEQTILSVLNQNYPNIEYLVVDGGSTDETLDILRRYEDRLTWVSEPDRGQAHALNKGFRRARGEIFGWLNSDDTYEPRAIRTVVEFFRRCPEVAMVYSDGNLIDENGHVTARVVVQDFVWEDLLFSTYMPQPTVFFRREVVERIGPFDENLHILMDHDFWIRTGAQFRIQRLPAILANLRYYKGTKSTSHPGACWPEMLIVLRKAFDTLPSAKSFKHLEYFAYCNAHWNAGLAYHYRAGRVEEAQSHLRQALQAAPLAQGGHRYALAALTHAALDSPRHQGPEYLQKLFADIPEMADALRPLESRLLGGIHLAMASRACGRSRRRAALSNLVRAIQANPFSLIQWTPYAVSFKILIGRRLTRSLRQVRRRLLGQRHYNTPEPEG
jgi:glycosyltransferase involved in cell wall biosynthesis